MTEPVTSEEIRAVGARLPRNDAEEKALGAAQYLDDIALPGMLHTAFALSPLAHARIVSVEAGAARAQPGVHAVLAGEDLPGLGGGAIKDMPFLACGKVRYVGEPVAAVAAETPALAEAAARLVDVEYEELPAVLTIEDALAPGAPLVHEDIGAYELSHAVEHGGNVLSRQEIVEGDVDAAWAECDVVVENAFVTGAQYHHALEPTGAVAALLTAEE